MKKITTLFLVTAFLLFSNFVLANETENFLTGRKIVIDAGHGGKDPGTTQCAGLYESDANLNIAFQLKAKLEENGAEVFMTRDDDTYLTNEDRYDYANSTGSDALISIHLNGSLDHTKNGTLSLYSKPRKDQEFTGILHSSMLAELALPDLGTTNFMSGVILRFNGPASLQEPLYLSNTAECLALKDGTGIRQQQIVNALFNGLDVWFSEDREVFLSPGQFKN
ncbi:N-acetylmuramoyl-L-alanine amidase [Patescibacteria group bacterium]|nr:N-acetylmuramoyl-L-alanine amidase [Patescibacteria group bacterium]